MIIPHVHKSLYDIHAAAHALPAPERIGFLDAQHRRWCQLRETFSQEWPLDDGSDFTLVIAGIRRLRERLR